MGKLTIINALGLEVKVTDCNYIGQGKIPVGESISADVEAATFNSLTLRIEVNGQDYGYNLNKDHWYGGNNNTQYPLSMNMVNIILLGQDGDKIQTSISYQLMDNLLPSPAACAYSGDYKYLVLDY